MTDKDIAVARSRRRQRRKTRRHPDDEEKPPMRGECAVCGKPVQSSVPPRKDASTPKFCDDHDEDDLRAMHEHFEDMRHTEEAERRAEQYRQR